MRGVGSRTYILFLINLKFELIELNYITILNFYVAWTFSYYSQPHNQIHPNMGTIWGTVFYD